ncbi:MAG TPA: heavy metal-binding domain-containing protein [Acidimicrobiales bacterium]|nr:heavy metal-binding domain-containing protein [Acidimicrobiales bacterium]
MSGPPPPPPSSEGPGGTAPSGDLPEAARSRLAEGAGPGGTWTSDLSVSELSAVERCGFTPAGMVVGMTVYQFGLQGYGSQFQGGALGSGMGGQLYMTPGWAGGYQQTYVCQHATYGHMPGYNFEDLWYERGLTEAYTIAIDRLREEADLLGAHGVVGVRYQSKRLPLASSAPVIEIRMVGTAIRREGSPLLSEPFTSHLSGQQFAKLMDTGWVPGALVVGVGAIRSYGGCVVGDGTSSGASAFNQYASGEFRQRSDAIQHCRRFAVDRLETHATGYGERVVGVDVAAQFHSTMEDTMLVENVMLGTAVRRFRHIEEPQPARVTVGLADVSR